MVFFGVLWLVFCYLLFRLVLCIVELVIRYCVILSVRLGRKLFLVVDEILLVVFFER